mmetsp:Transcript_48900/g.140033  ORF Transcript_48900/g.140033 Transcript_48900/m.140033 type:complete len:306 (+) Transcript_48900:3-920(+)
MGRPVEGVGEEPRLQVHALRLDTQELRLGPAAAFGLACASCAALVCLVTVFAAGPPGILILYSWGWAVWLSHLAGSCDQPLDSWLGAYLVYTAVMTCCSGLLFQVLCRWSPLAGGRSQVPPRVKIFKLFNPVVPLLWLLYGRMLLARSATCEQTSPQLHSFVGIFSCVFLALHSIHVAWLVMTVAGIPLLLFLARRGSLHPFLLWLASHGLLQTAGGASPNTIYELEAVEYRPELFADPDVASDSRPQGECCICLQAYEATKPIRRTPCGHFMHHECLGMWLQSARTCPACRANLDGQQGFPGVV